MSQSTKPGLRERKKAQTRRTIQEHALRLFMEKGYEATTVQEIAAAAGVSHMTFFRYFPTKEDVVLSDDYDPMLMALVASRPADEPAIDTLRHAIGDGFRQIYAVDREALLARTRLIVSTPALRARLWEQQAASEGMLTAAMAARVGGAMTFRTRLIAAACFAAITVATVAWAENDGTPPLPELMDQALAMLSEGLR
ncbi:MAG: acyl-CoA-like ligand-binding transcription factor [Anaerolineae bacterium]